MCVRELARSGWLSASYLKLPDLLRHVARNAAEAEVAGRPRRHSLIRAHVQHWKNAVVESKIERFMTELAEVFRTSPHVSARTRSESSRSSLSPDVEFVRAPELAVAHLALVRQVHRVVSWVDDSLFVLALAPLSPHPDHAGFVLHAVFVARSPSSSAVVLVKLCYTAVGSCEWVRVVTRTSARSHGQASIPSG